VVSGFAIIYLNSFMTRAESDFLSAFNAAYAIFRVTHPRMTKYMGGAYHQSMDRNASILLLAQDCYTLSILRPDTAQQVISKWTLNALKQHLKNQEFIEITQAASSQREKAFLEGLWSAEPYDGKAISAICSFVTKPQPIKATDCCFPVLLLRLLHPYSLESLSSI
jgi:hypothetical protein